MRHFHARDTSSSLRMCGITRLCQIFAEMSVKSALYQDSIYATDKKRFHLEQIGY